MSPGTEKTILEQCYRSRLPLPTKIQNAPELMRGVELYFTAFMELTTCRAIGFGDGPIPWTATQRYCEVNEIEGEQREDLFYLVGYMDAAYLKWRKQQSDKK